VAKTGGEKKESAIDMTSDTEEDGAAPPAATPTTPLDATPTTLHPECPKCQRASEKGAAESAANARAQQYKLDLPLDVALVQSVLGQVRTENLKRVLEAWIEKPSLTTITHDRLAEMQAASSKKRKYY
jgi:hypothetical protein